MIANSGKEDVNYISENDKEIELRLSKEYSSNVYEDLDALSNWEFLGISDHCMKCKKKEKYIHQNRNTFADRVFTEPSDGIQKRSLSSGYVLKGHGE